MVDAARTDRVMAWLRAALVDADDDAAPQLYAILDGARDERIVPLLQRSAAAHRCLFDGALDPELAAAAPYLVALDPDAASTRALVAAAWGQAWGIFMATTAGLDELRAHLRRFLRVVDEQRRPLMFRYYDPRVLRVYLPTCTYAELLLVFGPVREFLVEDEDPARALQLRRGAGELDVVATDL